MAIDQLDVRIPPGVFLWWDSHLSPNLYLWIGRMPSRPSQQQFDRPRQNNGPDEHAGGGFRKQFFAYLLFHVTESERVPIWISAALAA